MQLTQRQKEMILKRQSEINLIIQTHFASFEQEDGFIYEYNPQTMEVVKKEDLNKKPDGNDSKTRSTEPTAPRAKRRK